MIFLRIAFLIAPWCFVWLVAIGCSRQDSVLDEVSAEPFPLSEVAGAELAESESDRSGDEMLLRYETIAESHSDPLGLRKVLGEFYQEWGECAGEAAALHALEQHRSLLPQAFAGWVRNDADAPGRWVLSLVDGGRRERVAWLAAGLLHSLPPDDHRARSQWVARVAGHAGCEELVAEVATSWGKQHPQQALDWLEGLAQGGCPIRRRRKDFQRLGRDGSSDGELLA